MILNDVKDSCKLLGSRSLLRRGFAMVSRAEGCVAVVWFVGRPRGIAPTVGLWGDHEGSVLRLVCGRPRGIAPTVDGAR